MENDLVLPHGPKILHPNVTGLLVQVAHGHRLKFGNIQGSRGDFVDLVFVPGGGGSGGRPFLFDIGSFHRSRRRLQALSRWLDYGARRVVSAPVTPIVSVHRAVAIHVPSWTLGWPGSGFL